MTQRTRRGWLLGLTLAIALVATACGDDDAGGGSGGEASLSGSITIDGSSTVAPVSEAVAEEFRKEQSGVQVTVGTSGTGGGFTKFCAGETDISDASRPIKDEEKAACEKAGIAYDEFAIANDALTVVVNKDNDWVECLTVEQLKKIWAPNSKVDNWKQVDPSFPDQELALFGPGTDSGTFDYFTDEINGEEGASRTDYQASEDDNVVVQGVEGNKGAMGYFGFTYFEENADKLEAVQVDGGQGCVTPSSEAVQDGSYTPLGRQLFIYPAQNALADKPQVKAFVEYYVENIDEIADAAGFIPLNEKQKAELRTKFDQLLGS